MKIRTKFLAAALAATMTLGCALTASAFETKPTLTLQGNESSPLTLTNGGASATLTLKASAFNEVRGAKITVEFPNTGLTLSSITVTDTDTDTENKWTLDANNYKFDADGKKITMVDVFNFDDTVKKDNLNLNLNFNVIDASIGTYEVKVSGDFADDTADKVYPVKANANLVIGREEASATNLDDLNSSIENAKDYFIPYGGAYIKGETGDINLSKDKNGKFSLVEGVANDDKIGLLKCKLPEAGKVTTFGASNSLVENKNTAIQFGSYIDEINDTNGTFGTLIIVSGPLSNKLLGQGYKKGTYANALNSFNGNVESLLNDIITKFGTKTTETTNWFDGKLHPYTYGTTNEVVYAAVVPQTKYMWRNSDTNYTKLQYAVSCTGLDDTTKKAYVYTAVGYSLKNNTYAFSTEVQSASFDSLNATN